MVTKSVKIGPDVETEIASRFLRAFANWPSVQEKSEGGRGYWPSQA
jgi:hypothetical protein